MGLEKGQGLVLAASKSLVWQQARIQEFSSFFSILALPLARSLDKSLSLLLWLTGVSYFVDGDSRDRNHCLEGF